MTPEQEQKLRDAVHCDTLYQQILAECHAMEEPFMNMRDRLSPEDRGILDRYIALCEELEYRRTCLAAEMADA